MSRSHRWNKVLRGDQYAVALALIEDGEVVLGVLGCPNLPRNISDAGSERGSIFAAVRGEGAQELDMKGLHIRDIHVDQATKNKILHSVNPSKKHTLLNLIPQR